MPATLVAGEMAIDNRLVRGIDDDDREEGSRSVCTGIATESVGFRVETRVIGLSGEWEAKSAFKSGGLDSVLNPRASEGFEGMDSEKDRVDDASSATVALPGKHQKGPRYRESSFLHAEFQVCC